MAKKTAKRKYIQQQSKATAQQQAAVNRAKVQAAGGSARPGFGGQKGPWSHIQKGLSASSLGGTAPLGSGPSPAGPPQPVPEDPRSTAYYQTAERGARTLRDNSVLDLTYDVQQGANQYGFNVNTDKYATDLTVDPSNPFSKMALLQRSYEQQKAGTMNEYASSGQLYSGAFGAQKKENQFQNDAGNQSLKDAFQALLEQARRGKRDAGAEYDSTTSTAALAALNQNLGA